MGRDLGPWHRVALCEGTTPFLEGQTIAQPHPTVLEVQKWDFHVHTEDLHSAGAPGFQSERKDFGEKLVFSATVVYSLGYFL